MKPIVHAVEEELPSCSLNIRGVRQRGSPMRGRVRQVGDIGPTEPAWPSHRYRMRTYATTPALSSVNRRREKLGLILPLDKSESHGIVCA